MADPPSAFQQKWRTARKEHRCCECRRVIQPGDRYEHSSGVWDGSPDSYATCERCERIRSAHIAALSDDDECWPVFGELLVAIGECAREDHQYLRRFRTAWKTSRGQL